MKPVYIEIDKDGNKCYYKNKKMTILHREDGPAIEWSDGTKFWCINGKYHREDGPAIEWANGSKEWYINGVEYTKEAFDKYIAEKNKPQDCAGKVVEIEGKKYKLTPI